MNHRRLVLIAALAVPMGVSHARAEDAAKPAEAPAKWSDTIKIGAQIEAGIVGNPSGPSNNINYGQLYTDKSNSPQVNQMLLSIGRALDPKAEGYDFGFKLQGMFGSDTRYTHFGRLWDKVTRSPYQYSINEADLYVHAPWLTEGGTDITLGLFPTPIGFETIDASTNPFYTHSYIYNFGIPVNHSGGYAVQHVTPMLDVYAGVTGGNQTIIGSDNNSSASFLGGLKVTLMDGALSVLALTHIGPENASRAIKPLNASSYNRAYNDIVVTYKATDALTFTTEFNYIREDLGSVQPSGIKNAEAGGVAQYAAYALNDQWTLNARAEVFFDTRSYFVGAYPSSQGPIRAVEGYSYPFIGYSGRQTYGELTFGATYKPALPDWAGAVTMLVRPEARIDTVMNGTARYNNGKDRTAGLLSMDVVLTY